MAPSSEYLLRLDQPAMKTLQFRRGANGEEEQDARIEIDQRHVAADGQNRVAHEDDDDQQHRREEVHDRIGAERNDVFLGQRLDAVGDGLKEAVGADAIGAVAVLHAAQALALKQNRDRKKSREGDNDADDREQHHGNMLQRRREGNSPASDSAE